MIDRLAWWLVLLFPACRATRQGMVDGNAGMTPQDMHSDYYLGGWRDGRARFLDKTLVKPWTAKHGRR